MTSAALNLLATIAIVRWYGDSTYTDYMIDFAYLAILGILAELVPSNFSIFKVQDQPEFIKAISLFTIIVCVISFGVVCALLAFTPIFKSETYWIAGYSAALTLKKYLDIRLQSSGKLKDFFIIEMLIAGSRLILLGIFLHLQLSPSESIWSSLVIATTACYALWFIFHKEEFFSFLFVFNQQTLNQIFQYRNIYPKYYFSIFLKRIKDNIITITAPLVLINKQDLAAFFLAYRGLVFAVGQIRIFESLLNFREILQLSESINVMRMLLIALCSQIACIATAVIMINLSKINDIDWIPIITLSFVAWIYVFFSRVRVKLLSNYDINSLNISIIMFLSVIIAGFATQYFLNLKSVTLFCMIIVTAELISTLFLCINKRQKV